MRGSDMDDRSLLEDVHQLLETVLRPMLIGEFIEIRLSLAYESCHLYRREDIR